MPPTPTPPQPDEAQPDEAQPDEAQPDEAQPDEARPDAPRRPGDDPVRVRRQKIAKWTLLANRIGYLFFALAIAVFVLAFAFGFNATMSAIVITSLVIGSILLAPAIVLGYAVKAAERDDRERGL